MNNPLSGLIILLGLFLPDWRIGVGCIIGGTVATVAELVRFVVFYLENPGLENVACHIFHE